MTDQEMLERTHDLAPEQALSPLPDEAYYRPAPRQASRAARVGTLLVLVGLIWLAFELLSFGPSFRTAQGSTSIAVPSPSDRIEFDLGFGDVDIQTAAVPDVRVEMTQHGNWQGNPLVVEQSGGHVLVKNEVTAGLSGWCFGRCDLSYHIIAPAGVNMLVHTSSGDISIAGATGQIEITSSSGDVTARDIAHGITATTSSGDVTLSQIGGRLAVRTSSGDVRLEDGQVVDANVQTNSGAIDLAGVAGALTLHSDSGDVTLHDAQNGQLDIQTSSGEVDYSGGLAGDSSITTSSGDVMLHLPADSSFALDASTSSGDLDSEFELRGGQQRERALSGVAGAGGAALKIATGSGDVTIDQQ
jgi:hypothetical protein